MINGVWLLRERKVILFSATSSLAIERFITRCISVPVVLRFVSEYELKTGISPI